MKTYKLLASLVFIVFLLGIGLGYTSAKNSCFDNGTPIASRDLNVQKAFVKNTTPNSDDDLVAMDYSIELNRIGQKYITGNCGNSKSGTFAIGELNFEELLPEGFTFEGVVMEGLSTKLLASTDLIQDGKTVFFEKINNTTTQQKVILHFPHVVEFEPVRAGKSGNGAIKSWDPYVVRYDENGKLISKTSGNTLTWRFILRTASKAGTVTFNGTQALFNSTASVNQSMKRPNGNAWGYCKFPDHKKCTSDSSLIEYETPFETATLQLYNRPTLSSSRSDLYVNETAAYTFKWSEAFSNTKSTFTTDTSYLTFSTPTNTAPQITTSLSGVRPKESSVINVTTVFSDFKKLNGTSISLNHSVPIAVKLPKIVLAGSFADSLKKEIKVNQSDTLAFRLVTQENQSFTPTKPFTYTVTSSLPAALPVTSPTNLFTVPLNAKASANEVTVTIGLKDFSGSTVEKKLKIIEDGVSLSANELKVQVGSNATPLYGFRDQAGSNAIPTWFSGYRLTIESGDTDAIEIVPSNTANRPMIKGKSRGKVYVRLTALETVKIDTDNDSKTSPVDQLQPKQVNGSDLSVRFKVLVYEDPTQINTSDLY
ncbi:hypothetical protein [Exiguobacterium acetylicum]|uniref:hypothetical protein n=1 Tax=Exiguobacterium acetylicum TaxID=41170 RepID=UPI001EE1B17B|nr:hypothetical protein [Exiguobacterium acetylicum]UKS55249.1 hypothetical protein K6T22_11955 [Exiguobacterium acetylicum]